MVNCVFNIRSKYCHVSLVLFGVLVAAQAQCDGFSFMQTLAYIRSDQYPHQQEIEDSSHKINGMPVYGYDRASHQSTEPTTWIISFNNFATDQALEAVCKRFDQINGSNCDYVGHKDAMPVVIITAPEQDLMALPSLAAEFIEVDGDTKLIMPTYHRELTSTLSVEEHWGLDRINGRGGLDHQEIMPTKGNGVNIFSLDTGIKVRHPDFNGRALPSVDFSKYNWFTRKHYVECQIDDASCATDIQGHGTHTAGIAVSQTYGVAKGATIHAAKVLGDNGAGKWSWLLGAMDWVVTKVQDEGIKQAIITASLGGMGPDAAVKSAISKCNQVGISIVVAAGNENQNACKFLPSSIPAAITVGSIDEYDVRSYFSNTGPCVDLFAPGSNIISLNVGLGGPIMMSGTSMATPFVAGAAALALGENPDLTPAGLMEYLRNISTVGCITDLPENTENRLLYTGPKTAETTCTARGGTTKQKAWSMRPMPQVRQFPVKR